jgi:myo-inositol-1(or 4)-monophosphatase
MAAGALMVEEAGGRVTDYSNRPIDLFGGQIVVSNGHLHEDMLTVIDAAGR